MAHTPFGEGWSHEVILHNDITPSIARLGPNRPGPEKEVFTPWRDTDLKPILLSLATGTPVAGPSHSGRLVGGDSRAFEHEAHRITRRVEFEQRDSIRGSRVVHFGLAGSGSLSAAFQAGRIELQFVDLNRRSGHPDLRLSASP